MRPNADVIKAWADGAKVQYQDTFGVWQDIAQPTWQEYVVYRVKPSVLPANDVEKYNVVVGDFWLTKYQSLVAVANVIPNQNKFVTLESSCISFDDLDKLIFRVNTLNNLSGFIHENG